MSRLGKLVNRKVAVSMKVEEITPNQREGPDPETACLRKLP